MRFFIPLNEFNELPYQLIPISCVIIKIARKHRLRQLLIRFDPKKK